MRELDHTSVIPAKAGIQLFDLPPDSLTGSSTRSQLDSGLRGNNGCQLTAMSIL
jgi:hypothetical protein